jgi:DNA-binding CsgD family transcriptional regulator
MGRIENCALRTAAGSVGNLWTEGLFSVQQVRKFIEWLSFHPTHNEIARALAVEYLAQFLVLGIRFGRVNQDDSIEVLGQFGYSDAENYQNRVIPSSEWRSLDAPDIQLINAGNTPAWVPQSNMYVSCIRDRGVVQGYLIVEFRQAIENSKKNLIAEIIEELCVPIALYLSFQNRTAHPMAPGTVILNGSRDSGAGHLSARQLLILRGMVEGKTNHELATEMGFSVSTIRHETMRIYQALAVSDRKEAAKKALTLSLI